MKHLSHIKFSSLTVLCISIVIAIYLRFAVIPYASVLWDEAVFLTWIYQIAHSIRAANAHDFIGWSMAQFQYPPLQSWMNGILTAPFTFNIQIARTVNLFWLLAGSLSIYFLGNYVDSDTQNQQHKTHLVGFVSAIFFLTSPLVLFLSAIVLKETMSSTLSALTILSYLKARQSHHPLRYGIAGFAILFMFMTKYQYGLFFCGIIALEAFVSFFFEKKKMRFLANHIIISFPIIIFSFFWLVYPVNRIAQFLAAVVYPSGYTYTGGATTFVNYVLYYPRAIIHFYAPTQAIGVFYIALFFYSLRFIKSVKKRMLIIGFSLVFFLLAKHTDNVQERYLMPIIPFFFILAAVSIVDIFHWMKQWKFPTLPIAIISSALFIGLFINVMPGKIFAVGALGMKGLAFPLPDYRDTWFNYDENTWPKIHPALAKETPADIASYIFSAVDPTKPINYMGAVNEVSPPYLDLVRFMAQQSSNITDKTVDYYDVTVEIDPQSRYATKDFELILSPRQAMIPTIKTDPTLTLIKSKKFNELGITIGIFAHHVNQP